MSKCSAADDTPSEENFVEFDRGIEVGFDPQPERGGEVDEGEAVTTINSWWNHLRCTTCGHSFRRGDRVTFDEARPPRVSHVDPMLQCAGDQKPADTEMRDLQAFTDGLLDAWPPPPDLLVSQLDAGHPLVSWHAGRFPRRTCMFCAHTFRPGELVIICPCEPLRPLCEAAVHRDPVRGLVCWESWRPGNRVNTCPITLRRLDA